MSYAHNKGLREVGFWAGNGPENDKYPRVETTVDPSWQYRERITVLNHLQHGKVHAQYKGPSACRVCGVSTGSRDFTDGTYVWPEGLAHYITMHSVKPPADFIEHAKTTVWLA
jgi:hypothetical protein